MNTIRTTTHRAGAVRAGGLALAAILVLAGCGGAETPTNQTTTDDSSPPSAGGTLKVAAAADAQPQFVMANRAGNWSWRRLVMESLVELDATQNPQPLLATSWEYDESRTALTLELREGITFHSGRDFTADDVVFTLEQVQDTANASQLAVWPRASTRSRRPAHMRW